MECLEPKAVLLDQWNDNISKIRELPGFENFLRPSAFERLRPAASGGPVIIIDLSTLRKDAIIVQSTGPLVLVCLPENLPGTLSCITQKMTQMFGRERAGRPRDRETSSKTPTSSLRSLWQHVCRPVVETLLAIGIRKQSRIRWCPTGALSSLPLHAAGPYDGSENLSDIFVSSYWAVRMSCTRQHCH